MLLACSGKPAADQTPASGYTVGSNPTQSPLFNVDHANGYRVEFQDSLSLITIFNGFDDRSDSITYVLLKKGQPVPNGVRANPVIRTPIETVGVFSSTHIGFLDQLGLAERIIGVTTPENITNNLVRQQYNAGKIADFGNTFNPNMEVILSKSPGLIFLTVLPSTKFNQYQTLIEAGIPVLIVAEWMENTPLGRAEWLKLFALLMGKTSDGLVKFSETKSRYLDLKNEVGRAINRPTVMSGLPFKDSWFVPGGNSYMARLFEDAGAKYFWKSSPNRGSLNLDIEAVFPYALKAEYWINTGTVRSISELLAKDSRYREFLPVKTGRVYNNNKRLNPEGGNAYWEEGVAQPNLILEDLIRIFHPELKLKHASSADSLHFYINLNEPIG